MRERQLLLATSVTSGCMIAHQVGGKAVRDALFLSNFPVALLPGMLVTAAVVSILVSILAVRMMAQWGPARVVPAAFGLSAVLQIGEWVLAGSNPHAAAVVVFLHIAALGPVLTSGFWSLAGESFDPRTARRVFGRIAAAGALGGVVGGLAGERIASAFGLAGALLLLAALHFVCAWMVRVLQARTSDAGPAEAKLGFRAGIESIARTAYVRRLVGVVLLVTISAALLDYVFKAEAAAASARGADLMQIFSVFYIAASLLTFFVQAGLSTVFLKHVGLGRTVGVLPAAVAFGGLGALTFPGLASAALARGIESVFRNSLFRAGYEVLFAPMPREVKRATKTLIDVGGERFGDILGGGLVALTLVALPASSGVALLGLAVALSLLTLWLARRLHQGYVEALEENLVRGVAGVEGLSVVDSTTRATLFRTLGATSWGSIAAYRTASESGRSSDVLPTAPEPAVESTAQPRDPIARVIRELHSGDAARVSAAMSDGIPTESTLPHLIPLLAWDDVAQNVMATLRRADAEHLDMLLEGLTDPSQPFTVRRRIPQVLVAFPGERTVQGLLEGLADTRFEVRYRCGRALRQIVDTSPALAPDARSILEAVRRETSIGRHVWASQRLIDRDHDALDDDILDEVLRERANNSLAHVFTLLSLVHSREAVRMAFRGLHTDDRMARGTALEYIEGLLPEDIWSSLRPFLDDDRSMKRQARPTNTVLAELMGAHESIELRLEALRSVDANDEPPEDRGSEKD